jgi:hypothetical protein
MFPKVFEAHSIVSFTLKDYDYATLFAQDWRGKIFIDFETFFDLETNEILVENQ